MRRGSPCARGRHRTDGAPTQAGTSLACVAGVPRTIAQKIIDDHLIAGHPEPGKPISIAIDQTLTQDATGTLAMLELEALQLDRVRTQLSVQYVDHNLLEEDHRNGDDHLFLYSACQRFGVWHSRPGNGISHALHMEYFSAPGKTLLGSDSHTCANGAVGMLAIGAGGLQVAMAMAGHPFQMRMPRSFGVELTGRLPSWVSAKDVVLEMLRRHGVRGARGHALEYHGPGVSTLSVWDRHVIANMGAELGATATLFPADAQVQAFLATRGRGNAFRPSAPDLGATYDKEDRIALDQLEPLIAKPSSPGNVVPVRDVLGTPIHQAYIGSSANPGYRDFAIVAHVVQELGPIPPTVSLDVNPSTSRVVRQLARAGLLTPLLEGGARLHQAGCNGCIGMGQAPASGKNSLRTTPRNFPGRSGTREDSVWLCSPETAVASAISGTISDPRDLGIPHTDFETPRLLELGLHGFAPPDPGEIGLRRLEKGPSIGTLPDLPPLSEDARATVVLRLGDDVSTDEILPAGARVLPHRSNVEQIAKFCFADVDENYVENARRLDNHCIIAGENYGQGSSREHAALAPRSLGLAFVLARSFSRIHRQNLINFGVLPLCGSARDLGVLRRGDTLRIPGVFDQLDAGPDVRVEGGSQSVVARHDLDPDERAVLRAGGLIAHVRSRASLLSEQARAVARPK